MITKLRLKACPKIGRLDRAVRNVGDAQDLHTPTPQTPRLSSYELLGYPADPALRRQRPQRS